MYCKYKRLAEAEQKPESSTKPGYIKKQKQAFINKQPWQN